MSTIKASTTSTTAFSVVSDTTGTLVFQTGATPTTAMTLGSDQSVTFAGTPTYSSGTANGVAYLNGSKVLTTGSALVFDGTNLGVGLTPTTWSLGKALQVGTSGDAAILGYDKNAYFIANGYYNSGYKYTTTGYASQYSQEVGAHIWKTAASGTAGNAITFTQAMTLTAAGDLGIGTTSPASVAGYKLIEVQGSTGGIFQTSASGNSVKARFYSTNIQGYAGTTSNHPFAFLTNDIERVTIDTSGNLLVGTTSQGTTEKLHVSSATTEVARFTNSVNTSGYSGIRVVVGASDTSTWHFRGETRGVSNWYLYGNGTTSYSSDSRLKKNIETTRDGYLNDLMQLRVVKYNWINSEETTPKELGLIAQEVEQVFPNLVQEHDIEGVDGQRKHIKHSVMEFILIKAIQELKAEFDAYKASHP